MTERARRRTRRRLLSTGASTAAGLLIAGCADSGWIGGSVGSGDGSVSTGADGEGGRVYVPPHVHGRRVAGTGRAGGYAVGLAFSVPDYYWTVDGRTTTRVTSGDDEGIYLLGYVWAPEAGTVMADVDLRATVTAAGTTVAETSLVPTLSQRWGLFHGGNLALGTDTEYRVDLRVSGGDARRTRRFEGTFEPEASTIVSLELDRGALDGIETTYLDAGDERGAVRPQTGDGLPLNRRPDLSGRPDAVVAEGRSGAATLAALALDPDESPLDDGASYLALLAATPHNDLWLPAMSVTGTLERSGETVYDGSFEPTLDPNLGYHYGAAVEAVEGGETLALSFPTPPQVARREGYETAFRSMPDTELTIER